MHGPVAARNFVREPPLAILRDAADDEIAFVDEPDTGVEKRLLARSRTRYLKDDLTAPLAYGDVESKALPSDEFPERARASLEAAILSRAPFDLDCPAEELTYKVLANDVVGVLGCGRRATYKHVGGTGWVLNNALDDDK